MPLTRLAPSALGTLSPLRGARVGTAVAVRISCIETAAATGALAIARRRRHNGSHEPLRAAETHSRREPQTGLPGGVLSVGGDLCGRLRPGAAGTRGARPARCAHALCDGRAWPPAAAVH